MSRKKIKKETQKSLPLMCIDHKGFQLKDEQNRPRNKEVMDIFKKKNSIVIISKTRFWHFVT